jgi:hypothetical protein
MFFQEKGSVLTRLLQCLKGCWRGDDLPEFEFGGHWLSLDECSDLGDTEYRLLAMTCPCEKKQPKI